jgi:hypothetical protein
MNTATTESILKIGQIVFDNHPLSWIEKNSEPFIAIKPICTALGLDFEAQRQLIERDAVLSSTACIIQAVGEDNKQREMVCLPLSYLNGWLFKISPARYEGESQAKIIRYQKECYQVLYRHFFPHSPKQAGRLKNTIQASRLELNFRKTGMCMRDQAQKEAVLIFRGNGSIADLDDCPRLKAMTLEALEKLYRDSLFPTPETQG